MKKDDLINKLIKNSPTKTTSILSKSSFFKDKDNIPTDLPILNIAFSGSPNGGMLSGLTTFAGESKTFKTLLGLYCVKAYLDRYDDAVCIIYDSEGGITPDYLDMQGIDPNRVIHTPIEHTEMLKFDLVKTLKELDRDDKVIVLIDSIGNLASLKELEDAENEKTVMEMQRAKGFKALFRMITPGLIAKDVPCIAIAHSYETMCLAGETLIKTSEGNKPIKDIKVGDYVYALNGLKEVTHAFNPSDLDGKNKTFLELSFEDGSTVRCTHDHKFLLDNKEWVEAHELKLGDNLL
jgi:hypothetical protein